MPRAFIDTIFSSNPGKAALIFGDQLRIEAPLAVTRHVELQLAGVRHHGLAAITIAGVAGAVVAGEVMIHLRVQRSLGQSLLQRIEQPALVERRTRVAAGQQLIEKRIRYRRFFASGHSGSPSFPLYPLTHEIHDSPGHLPSLPIPARTFLSRRFSRVRSVTTSLKAIGLTTKVLHLIGGCRAGRVPRQPARAGLKKRLTIAKATRA